MIYHQEFLSSIEHQTAAALRISDANKGQLHDLQDTVRSTENTMSRIVGEILSSQVRKQIIKTKTFFVCFASLN